MRVIAGNARKTQLKSPKGLHTRPTADRIKESVFNIIVSRVSDCCFLDLFAGTGGIGIEALSRGARCAVLVEKDKRVVAVIKENLKLTKTVAQAEVINGDVFKVLPHLTNQKFDIIFIDPPYYKGYYKKVLEDICRYKLLASGGIVIAESGKQEPPKERIADLDLVRRQKYGDTIISFYQIIQQ